jgi:hypothetical protein
MTTFSSAAAAIVASLAMVMSSSALGACKATLRGELVQAPDRPRALPQKFLVFWLFDGTQDNATMYAKSFQSFVVPNASTMLPIPFALDINSPKDCPGKLELGVGTHDRDSPDIFTYGDTPLAGRKTIQLDTFESVPVSSSWRKF